MWTCLNSVKLIRYLLVWRANSPLVRLPGCLSTGLSSVLGTIIANRLPTREAGPWRKALAQSNEDDGTESRPAQKRPRPCPGASWPIEAVLFVYPGKRVYGQGELILWELKLFGESADHGFFLEVILPAMEEAGYTSDPRWHSRNGLWGRFDIQAIYAARGPHWEPLVRDGRLNLRYRASPIRWAEGLTVGADSEPAFSRLTWLTPFDLKGIRANEDNVGPSGDTNGAAPTLQAILEALMSRLGALMPGRRNRSGDVRDILTPEEQSGLQNVMDQANRVSLCSKRLNPVPPNWPGRWIGTQTFDPIPSPLIPYLQLASILHIGRQTHFGCGTFTLA